MSDAPGTIPPAEAHTLRELVAPADGAIVSRTLARTGGGSITLFAFDALDGALDLVIGGRSVRAAAGEVVLMPAGVPHGLTAVATTRMELVMLREPAAGGSS